MRDAPAPAEAVDLLVLELGGLRCGLLLDAVREVVRAVLVTPLPGAPPVVEGVIDVRGEIVPVYDLRARFGLPARPLDPGERMVIAWTGDRLAAVRCDRTGDLEQVPPGAIEAAAALPGDGRHVAGLARLDDGLAVVHDLAAFLEDAERLTLDEALARLERAG
jgi:purine-binding chemotaxis protein CheW